MDNLCLSLLRESNIGSQNEILEFCSGAHNLVDVILKALVDEETVLSVKSNLLSILELQSSHLLKEIHDIELVLSIIKNVFASASSNIVQGQCLITTTAILLESSERFSGGEYNALFSQHINHLLDLINAVNSAGSVYVRSVAADSLLELELCYPLILKPCLENISSAAMKEFSAAHQQYSALLSLLVKHTAASYRLDTPLWDRYPELVLDGRFLNLKNTSTATSIHSNNQIVSFLVDQLPYCNPEGVVWITQNTVEMILYNTELRASCRMLKPLFFNSVYTFNSSVFHLLIYLEKVFGRELFDDEEHWLLLKQLLLNCSHPSLPEPVVHIYFEFLNDYLSRMFHQLKLVPDVSILLPNQFDSPETHLRKFLVLSNIMKHNNGTSPFLLKVINRIQREAKYNKCFQYKSVLMKILFKFLSDHEDVNCDDIARVIVVATADDVTVVPFVLHFIRLLQHSFPASEVPSFILASLINVYTQADSIVNISLFNYVLDIFQEAISQKSADSLKSILIYLYKFVSSNGICELLTWSLGHKILKLCCIAMKEYDISSFFYEINNILQVLISKCPIDDVQDRARLYLGLLQSLSDKKLKMIMHGPKQLLPCARSEDNNCHSQSYLQKLDRPIVHLLKVKQIAQPEGKFFLDGDASDIVSMYQNFIASNEPLRKLSLAVSIKISPVYNYLQCVEALAIFIEVPKTWGKIDPVMIGHVKENNLIDKQKKNVFTMACYPTYPLPVEGRIRAQFSLENIYHVCSLEPFEIEFQDFFCIMPIADAMVTKNEFFETFWNVLKNDFQSVIFFEHSEQVARAALKQKFESFIVFEDCQKTHVGIFLPPSYHILMRCEFKRLNTTVTFVSDCLCLLSLMNSFFKELL